MGVTILIHDLWWLLVSLIEEDPAASASQEEKAKSKKEKSKKKQKNKGTKGENQ